VGVGELGYLEKLRGAAGRLWGRVPSGRRLLVAAVGLAAFAGVLAVAYLSRSPAWTVLYSGDTSSVAEVVQALEEKRIEYRLDPLGQKVLVRPQDLGRARLETAGRGVPRGGTAGYELFDRTRFGMTESERKLQERRALEGELARTVASLSGVRSARVHLGLPEESPFVREKREPSASVVLSLAPGAELGPADVKAVKQVVAAAVPGLTPERVVVADDRGRLLDPEGAGASWRPLEEALREGVRRVLEAAFGAPVVVSVRVEVDETSEKVTEERAGEPVPVSRQQVAESYRGQGVVPGGVPGTGSNVPGYFVPSPGSGQGEYRKDQSTENFEIPVVRREIVRPAGSVRRVSVAAVVPAGVPPERVAEAEKLVAAAAGLDPSRDSVVVVAAAAPRQEPVPPAAVPWSLPPAALVLAAAVAAALLAALAVLAAARRKRRERRERKELIPVPAGVRAAPKPVTELVAEAVRRNPDAAAAVVKAWLREGSS